MKRLSGHAESVCDASVASVFELLRAVDRYPSWHGEVVRRVAVHERDREGYPATVDASLRVPIGPVRHDLELALAVGAEPPYRLTLTRLQNDPEDQEAFVAVWRLDQDRGTAIRLSIEAELELPRLLPLGDLGDKLATGFVHAAAAAAGGALAG